MMKRLPRIKGEGGKVLPTISGILNENLDLLTDLLGGDIELMICDENGNELEDPIEVEAFNEGNDDDEVVLDFLAKLVTDDGVLHDWSNHGLNVTESNTGGTVALDPDGTDAELENGIVEVEVTLTGEWDKGDDVTMTVAVYDANDDNVILGYEIDDAEEDIVEIIATPYKDETTVTASDESDGTASIEATIQNVNGMPVTGLDSTEDYDIYETGTTEELGSITSVDDDPDTDGTDHKYEIIWAHEDGTHNIDLYAEGVLIAEDLEVSITGN